MADTDRQFELAQKIARTVDRTRPRDGETWNAMARELYRQIEAGERPMPNVGAPTL